MLDYTTLTFPVTTVDPKVDLRPAPREFLGPRDKYYHDLCESPSETTFTCTQSRSDDPDAFAHMPVGLQLIGQTLEEEAVIAMAEIVVAALRSVNQSY